MAVSAAFVPMLLLVLALWSAGCVSPDANRTLASVPSAPEWRPGDRWTYDLTSGTERGTKIMEVIDERTIGDVRYYVVRHGDLDHYYTRSLNWAAASRDSKVEARMTPPHSGLVWPLEVGKRWSYRGVWEDQNSKRDLNDRFAVVALETVEVLAGRFEAFKVVREGSEQSFDEYWFAPAARSYVRWVGRRGDLQFEEQLREYRAAPRLIPDRISPK